MKMNSAWVVAGLGLIAVACSTPPSHAPTKPAPIPVQAIDLSGTWVGNFQYGFEENFRHVVFYVNFGQNGATLSGTSEEPNTFGKKFKIDASLARSKNSSFKSKPRRIPIPKLFASWKGTILGNQVHLTKTYDGTGEVSHSVNYDGWISSSGVTIGGLWSIVEEGEVTSASFELERDHTLAKVGTPVDDLSRSASPIQLIEGDQKK